MIAKITSTYVNLTENSRLFVAQQLVERVQTFKDEFHVPVPLNLLVALVRLPRYMYRFLCCCSMQAVDQEDAQGDEKGKGFSVLVGRSATLRLQAKERSLLLSYDEADRLRAHNKVDARVESIERAVEDIRDELQGEAIFGSQRAANVAADASGGGTVARATSSRGLQEVAASVEKMQRSISSLTAVIDTMAVRLENIEKEHCSHGVEKEHPSHEAAVHPPQSNALRPACNRSDSSAALTLPTADDEGSSFPSFGLIARIPRLLSIAAHSGRTPAEVTSRSSTEAAHGSLGRALESAEEQLPTSLYPAGTTVYTGRPDESSSRRSSSRHSHSSPRSLSDRSSSRDQLQ